jgi:hypothetical protein
VEVERRGDEEQEPPTTDVSSAMRKNVAAILSQRSGEDVEIVDYESGAELEGVATVPATSLESYPTPVSRWGRLSRFAQRLVLELGASGALIVGAMVPHGESADLKTILIGLATAPAGAAMTEVIQKLRPDKEASGG